MWFYHVGQAGLELLTSGDLPAQNSQSAGITDVSHQTLLKVSAFQLIKGRGHDSPPKVTFPLTNTAPNVELQIQLGE